MFDKIEIMQMAQAMASHAATRQNTVAQNIANADTPGYRARDVASFADTYQASGGTPLRATRDGHWGGGNTPNKPEMIMRADPGVQSPNGNTVSLETEMVKGIEVKRQHDLALAIYQTSMGVLRTSLGRGR